MSKLLRAAALAVVAAGTLATTAHAECATFGEPTDRPIVKVPTPYGDPIEVYTPRSVDTNLHDCRSLIGVG
jgi:hypothetical protein